MRLTFLRRWATLFRAIRALVVTYSTCTIQTCLRLTACCCWILTTPPESITQLTPDYRFSKGQPQQSYIKVYIMYISSNHSLPCCNSSIHTSSNHSLPCCDASRNLNLVLLNRTLNLMTPYGNFNPITIHTDGLGSWSTKLWSTRFMVPHGGSSTRSPR